MSDWPHDLDDDACCHRCGFDAAEWWHLERIKPKDQREPEPQCDRPPPQDLHTVTVTEKR